MRVVTTKFSQNHRLAHPRPAVDQEAGHPVPLRICKQLGHHTEGELRNRIADPPIDADQLNTVVVREISSSLNVRQQMIVLAHDQSSTA
jgi:hypothetical protein